MNIVGVDVGGTFTDVILTESKTGRQYIHKLPSTPGNQEIAVIDGIQQLCSKYHLQPEDIGLVVHGTTVATNAMLERKGSHVVLLTTKGLEDILEIGRQHREDIYSLNATRPEPLVARADRIGVNERIDSEGQPIIAMDQDELTSAIQKALDRSPESIAISLLFSYRNPKHEQTLLRELQKRSKAYIVASSDVLPEFREFERTSTTVLEAYLGPLVIGYLERLDKSLKELVPKTKLAVIQSNGGTMLASEVRGRAIGLAISGLAGGVIGGWQIAKQWGISKAITLDMGGTSCDISAIIEDIIVKPDNEIAGLPLRMPSTDVKTIGAGGGSIAWVDDADILHVGPQSAGADPGPAAYGKGGTWATVTDANLVLGRLNHDYFLGGALKLDIDLARDAVSRLANKLGMSVEETALGIIKISTSNMVQAIREVTVERGSDPRQFVLVPFGGAGATQAVDIAELLDIDSILVPPYPGITSALGLVCTDLRVDLMRTILTDATKNSEEILVHALNELSDEATKNLMNQGIEVEDVHISWIVDMRYKGQSHEIPVTLNKELRDYTKQSIERFESLHEEAYGYRFNERQVEWVTARVVAQSKSNEYTPYTHSVREESPEEGSRNILLSDGTRRSATIYRREKLAIGQQVTGPSIIEQIDTTTYIAPDWIADQREDGTLWIRRVKS